MYPRALIALALLTSSAHAADLPPSAYADPMTTGSISAPRAPADEIVTGSINPGPNGLVADPVRDTCETNGFIRLLFGTGENACLTPGGSAYDPARDNNDDTEVADSGGNGPGAGPGRDPAGGGDGDGGGDPGDGGGDPGDGGGDPGDGGAGPGDGGGHPGPCGCKP